MARPSAKAATKPAVADLLSSDITLITGEAVSTIPTTADRATKKKVIPAMVPVKALTPGEGQTIVTCVNSCAMPSYGIVMATGERRIVQESDVKYLLGTGNFTL